MLCTSAATPDKLLGGGAKGVVPNGAPARQPVPWQVESTGTVNGSWVVTLKGPLMPNPALAESSVKYSPRSAYIPKPPRTTRLCCAAGLQANPMRGANIHCRPVRVESLTFLNPYA